jgi:phage gpG-like protein
MPDLGTVKFVLRSAIQLRTTPAGMLRLGREIVAQIKRRFVNHGPPDGPPWQTKWVKAIGADDGRAVLTGQSGRLANSWEVEVAGNKVTVYTAIPYAHVHQLGTTKYGGPIPTIRPKTARALFIPLTDRAITSMRYGGHGGVPVVRLPTRGKKLKSGEFAPLKKGRLTKEGKLEYWDAKEEVWKAGKPDFIFLRKVDIRPRPMLPTSQQEQRHQINTALGLFKPVAVPA